jgi:hypothetical protein
MPQVWSCIIPKAVTRTVTMQASRVWLFICAILAGCSGSSGSGQAPPPPAAVLADIPALMESYHVPGVSIAIVKDSKVVGHNGANAGFQLAMLAHRSKGMAAVVMTNGDNGGPLIDKILVIIENTEHWPGF